MELRHRCLAGCGPLFALLKVSQPQGSRRVGLGVVRSVSADGRLRTVVFRLKRDPVGLEKDQSRGAER